VRKNRVSTNVPPRFEQYKNQGNTSNLVQSHFESPASKWLESGMAPLVSRGFYPAYWGLNQPTPSLLTCVSLCVSLCISAVEAGPLCPCFSSDTHTHTHTHAHRTRRSTECQVFANTALTATADSNVAWKICSLHDPH